MKLANQSMNACLKGSLFLNLLLAVVVAFQSYRALYRSNSASFSRPESLASKPVPVSSPKDTTGPASFHWTQLDAPDFPSFIQNLRSVGCPEATIRDIVQGELREIYSEPNQAPTGKDTNPMVELAAGSTNSMSHSFDDVVQLTATLLNAAQATAEASVVEAPFATQRPNTSTQISGQTQPLAAAPTIPAAFLVGNHPQAASPTTELSLTTTDPNLNSATASIIQNMRTQFADTLSNSSPVDAKTYNRDWLVAQRQSDEFFASMFGGDAMIAAQAAAAQKRAAERRALSVSALSVSNQ